MMITFYNAKNIVIASGDQTSTIEFAEKIVLTEFNFNDTFSSNECLPNDMFFKYRKDKDPIEEIDSKDQVEEPVFSVDMVMPPRIIEPQPIFNYELKKKLDRELNDIQIEREKIYPRDRLRIDNLPKDITVAEILALCSTDNLRVFMYTKIRIAVISNIPQDQVYRIRNHVNGTKVRGYILGCQLI